jgi:tRNA (cytidine/uridine-2'-O-)-methyltransferase
MDYWQYLQWTTWPSFAALQAGHPEGRYHYFTTKTQRLYTSVHYQPGDFLVFGRETKGLPEALLQANAAACVTLPMFNPHIRSLNLATAVGIGLYEAIRQVGGDKQG